MVEKRVNPLLIGGVLLAAGLLSLVMCSQQPTRHQPIHQVPGFDPIVKRQDGDTQADTIKALQAYAREAVKKADALHAATENKMSQVLENRQQLSALARSSDDAHAELADTRTALASMEQTLASVQRELTALRTEQRSLKTPPFNEEGLPVGFGFDDPQSVHQDHQQGEWYNPIDWVEPEAESDQSNRFGGLLAGPTPVKTARHEATQAAETTTKQTVVVEPVYTLPKDATLVDGLALTALIGRIPVEGQTPDPYPVKIYIGKENLLANGHALPEVEGMIFSGLGFGDWNLSCVSARLMSATFIFADGSIVNHSNASEPLGYISDPSGVPCVSGKFVTNAPAFLSQRVGLSAIGAAGSAYAEAQQQRQTSNVTAATTSTVTGDINKLAAGEAVASATSEVSQWLLARQKQSFDAVVVSPGAAVSVHLDRSLPLDKSSIIRRVHYAQETTRTRVDLD